MIVHCHAGQGRTALVIAGYLMYANVTRTADETIKYIRDARPKCLKHKFNREYLEEIEESLRELRCVFPGSGSKLTLSRALKNQRMLIHGNERLD